MLHIYRSIDPYVYIHKRKISLKSKKNSRLFTTAVLMKKIQPRKKYQTSKDAAKYIAEAGGANNDDEVVDEKNDEEVAPYLARQSAPGLSSSILVKDPLPAGLPCLLIPNLNISIV